MRYILSNSHYDKDLTRKIPGEIQTHKITELIIKFILFMYVI